MLQLAGLLYAGLHPFHTPPNQVSWVPDANALRFGDYGTILTQQPFAPPARRERSVEIWMKPGMIEDSNTLLAFYSPDNPRQLSLMQSLSDLEVAIQTSFAWRRTKTDRFYIDNAFRGGGTAFWTFTFGSSATTVYRDGVLIRKTPITPSAGEMSGRLVVANSPVFSEPWSGVLKGLAVFDTKLDADAVGRHYSSWTKSGTPVLSAGDSCVALYLFDEHGGRVVHNRARGENDLYIPTKFTILRQSVLDPPWRAFNWHAGYWKDASVNLAGFMPFGFCLCAYLSARNWRSPVLWASVIGGVVSAVIELTQTQLPTRDSSMSDLLDNFLGSVFGALAYRGTAARLFYEMILWAQNRLRGSGRETECAQPTLPG